MRHDPRRHASGEIDPAGRQHLQREVAGLGAPDVDHDAQRLGGQRVVRGVVHCGVDDGGVRSAAAFKVAAKAGLSATDRATGRSHRRSAVRSRRRRVRRPTWWNRSIRNAHSAAWTLFIGAKSAWPPSEAQAM